MNGRLDYARLLRWAPVAIFVIAFGIRALMLARISREELLYTESASDSSKSLEEGINIAKTLCTTGRFADPFPWPTGPTAHLPPAYPAVTAILFWIFGTGVAGAMARNLLNIAGYSTLFAVLPRGAAALKLGRSAGVVAGFGGAIYPVFRSTEVFRGRDEWLAALLLLWLTIVAFRISEQSRIRLRSMLAYGFGWGALMYVQPATVIVFMVQLAFLVVWHKSEALRIRLGHAAVAVLMMLITVAPWTIRNRIAMGGWFFMRDNFGLELMVSNGEGARAAQSQNQASRWYWQRHPMGSPEGARQIRESGEREFNRRALYEAKQWITGHPREFLRLAVRRMVYFWSDMPSNPATFLARVLLSLLCALGLAGMWRGGLTGQCALLGAALGAYSLVYYLVQYSNRYVAPVSFALLLPAGYAVIRVFTGRLDQAKKSVTAVQTKSSQSSQ